MHPKAPNSSLANPGLSIGRAALLLALVLLLSLCAPTSVDAQAEQPAGTTGTAAVAPILSYQGRLVEPGTGAPKADGTYTFVFRIYDAASGGAELWNETKDLPVNNGLFSTFLGDTMAFPVNLFNGQSLWLGIKVGTDPEATPRQRLAPVAYALYADNADRLDGLDSSDFLRTSGGGTVSGNASSRPIVTVTQNSTHDGILATTNATDPGRGAVVGRAGSAGPTLNSVAGVFGTSANGRGVIGSSSTSHGVLGFSSAGIGVEGQSTGQIGVRGFSNSTTGRAVQGEATASSGAAYGVHGISRSTGGRGVFGETTAATGTTTGVYGQTASTGGRGVLGFATASSGTTYGVYGQSNSSAGRGVYGVATATSGTTYGVLGAVSSTSGYGGYFSAPSGGVAGRFIGAVQIVGNLSKSSGSFIIDHPLDPENKYLIHSFVESPDMMNIYNGNVTLDANGQAWVELPTYFQALNRDFRYQLTPIGGPGPNLYIAEQIANNRFRIAGGSPGLLVSWQVTGIRQDAYANANRIVPEVEKPAEERGTYLHPAAHGFPASRGLDARMGPAIETLSPAENTGLPQQ